MQLPPVQLWQLVELHVDWHEPPAQASQLPELHVDLHEPPEQVSQLPATHVDTLHVPAVQAAAVPGQFALLHLVHELGAQPVVQTPLALQ